MNRVLLNASNTMNQLQQQLDLIGHNIANVDTVGYKNRRGTFQELLAQQYNNQPLQQYEGGRNTPEGIRIGVGAKLAQTQLQLTQGSMKPTERMLDFAFTTEDQFFAVQYTSETGQEEVRYTRNGSLYLSPINNNEVMLVNSEGHPVLNTAGATIVFPDSITEVQLQPGGTVTASLPNGGALASELAVAQIIRPQLLQAMGGSLFALPAENIGEDALTYLQGAGRNGISLQQGMLEQSNVDLANEMTNLTIAQRSYQFNARSIQMADQMMGLVNGLKS
ncbi:flagellar hook-basal body protein [Sutcliffiella cohnii]|uniref:flagellar hook-basal body protein n=1 Tax=Sutcliffiella cohnii TaxID=33932 RepID=UPI002E1ABFBA|nr:flagellar hook-basal body protein [Sutcliffiella cohnii]